jgi:hypothetical protein
MKIDFYKTKTSAKKYATIEIYEEELDEEIEWLAEILGCKKWEIDYNLNF